MSDSNLWDVGTLEVQIPGPPGDPGPAPTLSIGTVTEVPIGGAAVTVSPSGIGAYTISFAVPRGPQGVEGPPGDAIAFSAVVVNTIPAGQPASGSVTGTSPNYTLTLNIPEGPQGDKGDTGAPGLIQAVIAGDGIEVDNTSTAAPIVSVLISTDTGNSAEISTVDSGVFVRQNLTDAQRLAVDALAPGVSTVDDIITALQAV